MATLTAPPRAPAPSPVATPAVPPPADAGLKLVPALCALCGVEDADPVAVGADFEYRTSPDEFLVVRCRRCSLLYLNPRPADSEAGRIYPDDYHAFAFEPSEYGLAYRVRRRLEARRLLRWCEGLPANARILDIGCGDGFHLELLRDSGQRGWQLEGLDADARAVGAAGAKGLAVRRGTLEDAELPAGHYHLILLVMTVEHLSDPAGACRRAAELLAPGGKLVVVTDNAASLDASLFGGRHWGGYHFPRHTYLFSKATLTRLAAAASLEVERISTATSPVNWVYSLRNLLDDWGAPKWLVNRFGLKSVPALAAFTALDTLLTLVGRGGILHLVARKPLPPTSPPEGEGRKTGPVVIVGAGLAGLTAATFLRRHGVPVRVFEAGPHAGGLARSELGADGFTYDCGAHFVTNRLAAAVGVSASTRPMPRYGESVWHAGRAASYPFGLMRSPKYVASALVAKLRGLFAPKPASAAEFYRAAYGRKLADDIALPLTEAWSGAGGDAVAASVGEKFATSLPRTIMLKLAGKLTKRTVAVGYSSTARESPHVWHVYPEGGVGAVCDKLAEEVADCIQTRTPVEAILVEGGRAVGVVVGGETVRASAVVSTAPLPLLAKLVRGTDALSHLARFRYRPMVFVNLKFDGPSGLPDVVTWTPGPEFPFFRASDIGLGLPWLVPPGKSQVTCDIGCEVGDATWAAPDAELAARCLAGLEVIAPGITARYLGCRVVRTPHAYPVYRREYEPERKRFEAGTGVAGLYSVGRNGEFAHVLMEDVYWRTRRKLLELVGG